MPPTSASSLRQADSLKTTRSLPSPLDLSKNADRPGLTAEKLAALDHSHSRSSPHGGSPASSRSNPLSLHIPTAPSPPQITFAAMQYLPMPCLVLSTLKTVVFANEALRRLLTPDDHEVDSERALVGETLGQIGIDMLQNGRPVWINWEEFLDSIGQDDDDDDSSLLPNGRRRDSDPRSSGDTTPTALEPLGKAHVGEGKSTVHDVAVDVVISAQRCTWTTDKSTSQKKARSSGSSSAIRDESQSQITATMIVSAWYIEDLRYYTLTFTSSSSSVHLTSEEQPTPLAQPPKVSRHTVPKHRTSLQQQGSGSTSNSSSSSSRKSGSNSGPPSNVSSPSISIPSFPPRGPPSKSSTYSAPSVLQKATKLRQALLNCLSQPAYAIWKDETVGVPNEAIMRLAWPAEGPENDQRDFLSRFHVLSEDLSREWTLQDFPILQLIRDGKRFNGKRCAFKTPDGQLRIFDLDGSVIHDEVTGEMIGGVVLCKDVSDYMHTLEKQKKLTASQFEFVAQKIPQMVWTTTPSGMHEWFSQRWYDYTGLTEEESCGHGWKLPFHEDDMALTAERWANSLRTGEEYITEYRCRRKDGRWRWFLGRALPMRDEDGRIVKWFGTCTDIHDAVLQREAAKQLREQLLRVIETARVTLWCIDLERKISLMEGSLMWQNPGDTREDCIGRNVYELFGTAKQESDLDFYRQPIEDILEGRKYEDTTETQIESNGRAFRTRYVPLYRNTRTAGIEGASYIDGVIGVSMDVTELHRREQELRDQEKENSRLIANALAAKEASRLKSQFLATMSHEIRTPIAGVIGMSELLLDTKLDEEQRECAENIARSANGLLAVINDILDFSKVESGRLDVEEVPFSMSLVLQDVNKLLSFAAERKNLTYECHIEKRIQNDLRVLGDPGRLRQILTNLLTNSIKFTSEGRVMLRAMIENETSEVIRLRFEVEDTGIGIEEEVRKKLFTPFTQADSSTARRYGGTGLGLTISKNLVELMQGTISLESKLGIGTTARFEVPFKKTEFANNAAAVLESISDRLQADISISVSSDERHTPPVTPTVEGRQGTAATGAHGRYLAGPVIDDSSVLNEADRSSIHILVVEDNQINQQIALKTIKKLNFSVSAVWNGQECLDYLLAAEQKSPSSADRGNVKRVDIILMDCLMPIRDGYNATQAIRTQEPYCNLPGIKNVPIVAMTASAIQGDREKCRRAGMDDYLAKPVRGKVLERMLVKWAIERRRYLVSQGGLAALPVAGRPQQRLTGGARHLTQPSADSSSGATHEPKSFRFASESLISKSSDTENGSVLRRVAAEEKAMSLRDSKLLSSGEDPQVPPPARAGKDQYDEQGGQAKSRPRPSGPTHALTRENVFRLADAQGRGDEGEGSGSMPAMARVSSTEQAMRSDSSLAVHVQREESNNPLQRQASAAPAATPAAPAASGSGPR